MSDRAVAIIIALIGLVGTMCGSGGIVMYFLHKKEKKAEQRDKHIIDGLKLLMENDFVIFKALREHKINGESEKQEAKMNRFFREAFIK